MGILFVSVIRKIQASFRSLFMAGLLLVMVIIMPTYAEETPISNPDASFLWKISYKGKDVGALLGTVHIGTKESAISDQAALLIDQSTHLVTEIQIVFPTIQDEQRIYSQAIFSAFKPETRTIVERFTPQYAEGVRDALRKQGIVLLAQQDQLSNEFILMMMMLDIGKEYHADFGMEKLLRTYISGKTIENVGLEEIVESLEYYVEASKPLSKMMIEAWLDNQVLLQGLNKDLVQSYEKNDIEEFTRVMNQMEGISLHADENEADIAHYYDILLFDRNNAWLKTLSPLLKENVETENFHFIAVGAFHLLSDQGMVELLRGEGFVLTPLFDKEKAD